MKETESGYLLMTHCLNVVVHKAKPIKETTVARRLEWQLMAVELLTNVIE